MNSSVKPCEFSEVDGDFRSLIRGRTRSQAPAAWSSDAPFTNHAVAVAAAGGGDGFAEAAPKVKTGPSQQRNLQKHTMIWAMAPLLKRTYQCLLKKWTNHFR